MKIFVASDGREYKVPIINHKVIDDVELCMFGLCGKDCINCLAFPIPDNRKAFQEAKEKGIV